MRIFADPAARPAVAMMPESLSVCRPCVRPRPLPPDKNRPAGFPSVSIQSQQHWLSIRFPLRIRHQTIFSPAKPCHRGGCALGVLPPESHAWRCQNAQNSLATAGSERWVCGYRPHCRHCQSPWLTNRSPPQRRHPRNTNLPTVQTPQTVSKIGSPPISYGATGPIIEQPFVFTQGGRVPRAYHFVNAGLHT